jgi:hypothetical protein
MAVTLFTGGRDRSIADALRALVESGRREDREAATTVRTRSTRTATTVRQGDDAGGTLIVSTNGDGSPSHDRGRAAVFGW